MGVIRLKLEGKTFIVTGAGRGLGRGIAFALADEGANVAVNDRDEDRAIQVMEELPTFGGLQHIAVVGNVMDNDNARDMCLATHHEYGRLDGLVNNVGRGSSKEEQDSDARWDDLMDINIQGNHYMCKHAIPYMKDGGSIVVISSIAGAIATGSEIGYVTAKHALTGFVKSMALKYGHDNIRINAIQPGWVEGSLPDQENYPFGPSQVNMQKPRSSGWLPIRRAGRPREDYGRVVAFLLSDEAAFITGVNLPVDGGYLTG